MRRLAPLGLVILAGCAVEPSKLDLRIVPPDSPTPLAPNAPEVIPGPAGLAGPLAGPQAPIIIVIPPNALVARRRY